jgi:hypothetical protein
MATVRQSDPSKWRTWAEIQRDDLTFCSATGELDVATVNQRRQWGFKPMTRPTPDPIVDVQMTLDEWLENHPEAQKYVTKIYYLPDGAELPRDVTHLNRLTSIDHPDLDLRLGVVATAETAALADIILGIIDRAANDSDPKH